MELVRDVTAGTEHPPLAAVLPPHCSGMLAEVSGPREKIGSCGYTVVWRDLSSVLASMPEQLPLLL